MVCSFCCQTDDLSVHVIIGLSNGNTSEFAGLLVEADCHIIAFVDFFHCPIIRILLVFGGVGHLFFGVGFAEGVALVHHTDGVALAGKGKECEHKGIEVFVAVDDLSVDDAVHSVADGVRGTVFYTGSRGLYEVFFLAADGGQRKHGEKRYWDKNFLHINDLLLVNNVLVAIVIKVASN